MRVASITSSPSTSLFLSHLSLYPLPLSLSLSLQGRTNNSKSKSENPQPAGKKRSSSPNGSILALAPKPKRNALGDVTNNVSCTNHQPWKDGFLVPVQNTVVGNWRAHCFLRGLFVVVTQSLVQLFTPWGTCIL